MFVLLGTKPKERVGLAYHLISRLVAVYSVMLECVGSTIIIPSDEREVSERESRSVSHHGESFTPFTRQVVIYSKRMKNKNRIMQEAGHY